MDSAAILATSPSFKLDTATALSLAVALSLMPTAQLLTKFALPANSRPQYKYLFMWHAYDFLTHFIIEGSYLYHCFFSFLQLPMATSDYPHPASRGGEPISYLYNRSDRRYGARYSAAPMARLWQEYAKADRRWGGADLNVMSIELLTVGLAGPAALYICYLVAKVAAAQNHKVRAALTGRLWFVAVVLATGELYGGFMTFAPEWLSGNNALATEDPVYLWLYLFFFNILWVIIPLWVLWVAYNEICASFSLAQTDGAAKKSR